MRSLSSSIIAGRGGGGGAQVDALLTARLSFCWSSLLLSSTTASVFRDEFSDGSALSIGFSGLTATNGCTSSARFDAGHAESKFVVGDTLVKAGGVLEATLALLMAGRTRTRVWKSWPFRTGILLIDFKYSEGLIKVSVSDGDGNLGGMKGRAICLLNKLCMPFVGPLLLLPFEMPLPSSVCNCCSCSARKEALSDSLKSAGKDNGRFRRGCPVGYEYVQH